MPIRVAVLMFILFLGSQAAYGQPETIERNATAQEIAGNWELLPLPNPLEPKILKSNPWPAACQWYSYSESGDLKGIDKNPGPCRTFSSAQLDEAVAQVPAVVSWRYDLSPQFQKALVIVSRSDVKGYSEYWEPHMVVKAFSNGGETFKEGDLLLYLVNLKSHQIVWIRHLRRLL